MKELIKRSFKPYTTHNKIAIALLLLRVAIGGMMLTHGLGKLTTLLGNEPIKFADPLGIGLTPSLALTVFAEVFCSLFLILGVATRFSAIALSITMFIAAFIVHADDDFSSKEKALLYLLVYVVLAIAGAGKYSIDNGLSKKMT